MRKIKKQAENMRYILEAPKLELSEEEHVQIPLLQSDSWRRKWVELQGWREGGEGSWGCLQARGIFRRAESSS